MGTAENNDIGSCIKKGLQAGGHNGLGLRA